MAWRVWGERFETADLAGNLRVFQPVIFNSNVILDYIRTWLIVINNPTFTSLSASIYSNFNGMPKKKLYDSTNVITKSQMITLDNGVKEIFFQFNKPSFNALDKYHIVLNAVGYTGSGSSHLQWKKGYPDPVYQKNVDLGFCGRIKGPYALYFIGSGL